MTSRLRIILAVFICYCAGIAPLAADDVEPETSQSKFLAIRGGTIIDGTGAPARPNGTILISDDRVALVSTDKALMLPPHTAVIEADGKFILPGLIDGHTHYSAHAGPLYLHYGVTTVIDIGNIEPWIYQIREAIESGQVRGPRIYTTGRVIDSPPLIHLLGTTTTVETEREARQAVQQRIAAGADAIKVYKQLRPDLLRAVVQEAHAHGVPVAGHIAISATDAVVMGLDSIEHASGVSIATSTDQQLLQRAAETKYSDMWFMLTHASLPDTFYHMDRDSIAAFVQLLIDRGTSITPTIACYWAGVHPHSREYEASDRRLLDDPRYAFVPEFDRSWIFRAHDHFAEIKSGARYQRAFDNLEQFISEFSAAGGRVLAGSDATPYMMFGITLHRELELLVDAGVTPMKAILGATRFAAETYRKWHEVGSIEVGKFADVLILNSNPLENIKNTQDIHALIHNGQLTDRTLDGSFHNTVQPPQISDEAIDRFEEILFEH